MSKVSTIEEVEHSLLLHILEPTDDTLRVAKSKVKSFASKYGVKDFKGVGIDQNKAIIEFIKNGSGYGSTVRRLYNSLKK